MPLFNFEKLHHPYTLGAVAIFCAVGLSRGFKQLPNGTFYHQGMLDGENYVSEGQIDSSGNSFPLPTLARQNQLAPLFLPEGRFLPITINKGLFDAPKIEIPKIDLNAPVPQIDAKTGQVEVPKKGFILTNNISILGQPNTLKLGTENDKLTLVTPLPVFGKTSVKSATFYPGKKVIQFTLKDGQKKDFGENTTLVKLLFQASKQDNGFAKYTLIRRPANNSKPDSSTPIKFSVN